MEPVETERMVIAAFTEADLHRLHALLLCYESPFQTAAELCARRADERAHEALRRQIARLLV